MSAPSSTKTLMIQGTTSDAGKSFLVTGLCRLFKQRGINVAPFKPQNMALNSAVTADGGEIGRAQAVQAMAACIQPTTDMNPVLLKPNTNTGAQVIINGKAVSNMEAGAYHDYKKVAKKAVLRAHKRLVNKYDLIIVEGAGSPAEINLRQNDIANMGFAEAVDCPVLLIADIDKGGVFAHLVGTLELLSASERNRVKGFIINRFRGDFKLLESGLDWLEKKTGKPVIGVIPYMEGLMLEAEDALPSPTVTIEEKEDFQVVIPAFPRISNHTDFDALRQYPGVNVRFIGPRSTFPVADLIILPGSKSVRQDLNWLIEQGWQTEILRQLRYGVKLLGICGGFQMLGNVIEDPSGIEGKTGSTPGLGLLEMQTELKPDKQLRNVAGEISLANMHSKIKGYEIHAGITSGKALSSPLCQIAGRPEGALSNDGQIAGTYIHGIMDEASDVFLNWAGYKGKHIKTSFDDAREQTFNQIANVLCEHIDLIRLNKIIEG